MDTAFIQEKKKVDLKPVIGGMFGMIMIFVVLGMISGMTPKPELRYCCPHCGVCFATIEELQAHVASVHPGERQLIEIVWS